MKSFCIKTLSIIIAVFMIIPVVTSSAYTTDDVTEAAIDIICSNEGVYSSVNANDNGAVSIGTIGWHATRALNLLKTIVEANPENAVEIIGQELYDEILSSTDWETRIFSDSEADAVAQLLTTDEGIAAQDALIHENISGYVTHAVNCGLTDAKAIVYFADLENQMGVLGAQRVTQTAIELAGSVEDVTLDDMYNAAMNDTMAASSPSRRLAVYNDCKNLNFDDSYDTINYQTGEYEVTATTLRVRSGPSTLYETVASDIPKGTTVTVTEISGDWGKTTYKGTTGWICLLYTELITENEITATAIGDINGSGNIESADARLILRYCAKLENFSSSQKQYADVNADGSISALDARITLRAAANLENL